MVIPVWHDLNTNVVAGERLRRGSRMVTTTWWASAALSIWTLDGSAIWISIRDQVRTGVFRQPVDEIRRRAKPVVLLACAGRPTIPAEPVGGPGAPSRQRDAELGAAGTVGARAFQHAGGLTDLAIAGAYFSRR